MISNDDSNYPSASVSGGVSAFVSGISLLSLGTPDLLPSTRTPGPHVSTIINDICIINGHYANDELDMSRLQLGLSLEDAVARRYARTFPGTYMRPGELSRDGIYGTPDLVNVNRESDHSIKLSWLKSPLPDVSDELLQYDTLPIEIQAILDGVKYWKFWLQSKCYCHMLDLNVSDLEIYHVNSRPIRAPTWTRTFTSRELQSAWNLITKHRATMEKERRAPWAQHVHG